MPTHGPDLYRLSLSQLAELTGHDRRTVKARLRDLAPIAKNGKTLWYSAREALERIFLGESLDLTRERARLARAQAEREELRHAKDVGEVVEAAALDRSLIALATAASSKMQGLPRQLAPLVAVESSAATCERILDDGIRGALFDLSEEGRLALERLELEQQDAKRSRRAAASRKTKAA